MSTNLVEMRRNLLKLRGLGLSLPEVVKELSIQYHFSERIIYYDFARRKDWIEGILRTNAVVRIDDGRLLVEPLPISNTIDSRVIFTSEDNENHRESDTVMDKLFEIQSSRL